MRHLPEDDVCRRSPSSSVLRSMQADYLHHVKQFCAVKMGLEHVAAADDSRADFFARQQ